MSNNNGRRSFLKRLGMTGITGLTVGSAAVGSATANDTTGLTGVVYHDDESHSYIPEYYMAFFGPEEHQFRVNESEEDYYSVDIEPGEYTVLVTSPGYKDTVETITVESAATQNQNFVLEPANSGTLHGQVVTESGEPIDSDQSSVNLDGEYYPLTTSIDSNGEFEIDLQEAEGEDKEKWKVAPDILGYDYDDDPQPVSITEGETTKEEFEVSASNSADLTIIVDFSGEPAETEILFSGTAIDNRTLKPGETRLEDTVEAGTYDIAVNPNGYDSKVDLDVELEPGSQTTLYYEFEET